MIAFPTRLVLTVAGILACGVGAAYVVRSADQAATWLPLGIALASLAISILSSFKSELFEFAPRVLGGAVLLPKTEGGGPSLQFVLPLSFVNSGYGEGVIEWVALKFMPMNDGEPFLCGPLVEIDLTKFIQGKRLLHAENMLGALLPFPLKSKKVVAKAILFSPEPDGNGVTKPWKPDDYRMDVYLKASNLPKATKVFSVNKALTPKLVADFTSGGSIFVNNRQIEL